MAPTQVNETLNSSAPNLNSDLVYKLKKIEFLEQKIDELNDLCGGMDPYNEVGESEKKRLLEFGIEENADPFEITNRLVVMLEDSIEELQKLKDQIGPSAQAL